MVSKQPMNEEEARWRGRSDARTLAEAEEIKADKERLTRAKKYAGEMLEERILELQGIAKVAGSPKDNPKVSKPRSKKRGGINPAFIQNL